ncbi:type II toxin-antitoxin system VapC family toxin [Candidatus Sumerlaeota bacterium]|nr:type II toxin-antitoxin system VapC family toxin [Candidatus Sumerlaeota bacterium]
MATKVLDSWAIMAFFEDEPAADAVERLLQQAVEGKHRLLLCAVNWGEIYYATMRAVSPEAAEQKAREIASLPIEIVGVGEDLALARQAAIFKATKRIAYADCFAAALAKLRNAELVTGDPEFKEVGDEVTVSWLAS